MLAVAPAATQVNDVVPADGRDGSWREGRSTAQPTKWLLAELLARIAEQVSIFQEAAA